MRTLEEIQAKRDEEDKRVEEKVKATVLGCGVLTLCGLIVFAAVVFIIAMGIKMAFR
jgi:hypothetical protein